MDNIIKELKKIILKLAYKSKEGHIASSFSILDILWVLYDAVLNINPLDVKNSNRDIFILSKGHACLGLYTILAEKDFISYDDLQTFCKYNSILGGHPNLNKINGVEASTGSLGHGLPIAVGIALANKIKNKNNKVYCLIGDGEANEGSIWESVLLASHHKLNNLCCIIDYNHSNDRALDLNNLTNKFSSFGWDVIEIDGHNHEEIYKSLVIDTDNPKCIIANTIKGYGCKSMENNQEWHHKFPTETELNKFLEELK